MSKDFIQDVIKYKRTVIKNDKRAEPLAVLKQRIKKLPSPGKLSAALVNGSGIIAEIKRRSPRVKSFANAGDIKALARVYQQNGAAAISVLTDNKFFGGSLADLQEVKATAKIPVLRKDFIIDKYQVYQSRACGADAVLLIASILDDKHLLKLHKIVTALGMEALIEVHNESELFAVTGLFWLKDGVILGINNRDLKTLKVDLDTTRSLLCWAPVNMITIVESGIRNRRQMREFYRRGADGFLIGGALLTARSPARKLRNFCHEGTKTQKK